MYKAKVTDIIIGLIIHTYIAFYERVIYIYSANSNKSVYQIHKTILELVVIYLKI